MSAKSAVRQARRARPAATRVCWDLDNTLVASGRLLHAGMTLREAIVEAEPIRNMLVFYEAMQEQLPEAENFILSARMSAMRDDTFAWLERHGLTHPADVVILVPDAISKRRVWQALAIDSRLVIVDDLSYGHESDSPGVYEELVAFATQTASVYIGLDEIARIEGDSAAALEFAERTVETLG